MGGYLPTFYINWIFKNRQKPQTHKHSQFGRLPGGSLGGYLPTLYINWILHLGWLPTYIFYELDLAPWVATYIHFKIPGFSKMVKSRRHTGTGILVNYSEVFLVDYLPTFYINWILKNRQNPRTQKHRLLVELHRGLLGWLPTYILH